MKCKICGYHAKDLPHMSAHYRKAHPAKMKRTAKTIKSSGAGYCPTCGHKV